MQRKTLLALGAVLGLGVTASTEAVDCACSSAYSIGDRVVALVDNPSLSTQLPAGSTGTIVCGLNPPEFGLEILVRWDDYTLGTASNVEVCTCPGNPGGGTSGDWFVACAEIALLPAPVRNETQGTALPTLQEALNAANDGDLIEIDPVTLMEDGIVMPAGLNVTIRGAGRDQTIIDGMGLASAEPGSILSISGASTVIMSDLTIQNGDSSVSDEAGAITATGSSLALSRVNLVDNSHSGSFGVFVGHLNGIAGSSVVFDRCEVRGGNAPQRLSIDAGEFLFLNSLVVGDGLVRDIRGNGATISLVNSTVAGVITPANSSLNLTNSAVDGLIQLQFGGTLTASRSLFAGATGDNINGVPTFVDAMNGDYRLAAGSLGIDAADFDAYAVAGGSLFDFGGAPRLSDDAGTPNTGTGASLILDIGAFEFQGTTPSSGVCPGDADGDGSTDVSDITFVVSNLGCTSN